MESSVEGGLKIYIKWSRSVNQDGPHAHMAFLRQGQIFVLMHLYRENIENSVLQNVLKTNG